MTTQLAGWKTRFLPFNKDIENPVNSNRHKSHYLWEDILQPNSMFDLIENFVHIREEKDKVYDSRLGKIITIIPQDTQAFFPASKRLFTNYDFTPKSFLSINREL
jgi:type I site-specific restriction-modification system R (restriction) subunit